MSTNLDPGAVMGTTIKTEGAGSMRQDVLRMRSVLSVLLTGAVLLLWPGVSFAAAPIVGADCGSGASIEGSESAGKVTMGRGTGSNCTLTFTSPWANPPVCMAVDETNTSSGPTPAGARTTTTTVVINTSQVADNAVVSYICVGY
jgi:hypothetical protein